MSHPYKESTGFTLIELMVVVAIIGILAVIAIPEFRTSLIQGHVQEAKPYLMRIAAAQRSYLNRRGVYYSDSVGADITDEQDIEDNLGINLADAADFCFIIKQSNFISSSGSPDFEVWAVLRESTSTGNDTVSVDGTAISCTAADSKLASTNWVQDAGDVGGIGRIVVLRYPPIEGLDSATDNHRGASTTHDWVSGISISDAMLD